MKNLAVEEISARVSEDVEALFVTSGVQSLSKVQENKKRDICVGIWRLVSTELDQVDSYALYGAYPLDALSVERGGTDHQVRPNKWVCLFIGKKTLCSTYKNTLFYLTSTVILLSSKCALISTGSPFA